MNKHHKRIDVNYPPALENLVTKKSRYKVLYGGRGGGKSQTFAQDLSIKLAFGKLRALCTREIQRTIKDSVHRLLIDTIEDLKLLKYFNIRNDGVSSKSGSEIIYKGLRTNTSEIKSLQGIDIAWVEEAERVSEESFKILIPTIRKEDSEIWISFNPESESSPVYQRFILNPPPDSIIQEINYPDNPFFPEVLRKEMEYCKATDYEVYEHIWLGKLKKYANSLIFKGKYSIEEFDTPSDDYIDRLFFGIDWGYALSPFLAARMFIKDNCLYIDNEVGGIGVENEEIIDLLNMLPGSRKWKITADSARPELISYVRRKGFNIVGAEKGKGSVEDGIQFLRSFKNIIIHPRCKRVATDFSNYKWKTDKITGEILPIPIKLYDHAIDLCRYALEKYIKKQEFAGYTSTRDLSPV